MKSIAIEMIQIQFFFNSPMSTIWDKITIEKVFRETVGEGLHALPNALRLYRQSILSISFMVTMISWRGAVLLVQNGTLGRTYKSAPTSCGTFSTAPI